MPQAREGRESTRAVESSSAAPATACDNFEPVDRPLRNRLRLPLAALATTLGVLAWARPWEVDEAGRTLRRPPSESGGSAPTLLGAAAPDPATGAPEAPRGAGGAGGAPGAPHSPPDGSLLIRGTVRARDGAALYGVGVFATPKDRRASADDDDWATELDDEGQFELRLPQRGEWWLGAWAQGCTTAYVDLGPHRADEHVAIVLERAPELILRVVDPQGAPSPKAQVQVVPASELVRAKRAAPGEAGFRSVSGEVNAEGELRLRLPSLGPVEVYATAAGLTSQAIRLERPEGSVEVRLEPAGRVLLRLWHAETRAPLLAVRVDVRLRSVDAETAPVDIDICIGKEVVLSNVRRGRWRAHVACDGFLPAETRFELAAPGARLELDVALAPDSTRGWLVLLTDTGGDDVVTVFQRPRGATIEGWTVPVQNYAPLRDGRVELPSLPVGEHELLLLAVPLRALRIPDSRPPAGARCAHLAALLVEGQVTREVPVHLRPGTRLVLSELLPADAVLGTLRLFAPSGHELPLIGHGSRFSFLITRHRTYSSVAYPLGPYPWDEVEYEVETRSAGVQRRRAVR